MKFKLECEIGIDLSKYEKYVKYCQDINEDVLLLSDFLRQDLIEQTSFVDSISSITLTELH